MTPSRALPVLAIALVGFASPTAHAASWSMAPEACQEAAQSGRELASMVYQAETEATIVCATTGWITLGITCLQMAEWNDLADGVRGLEASVADAGGGAFAYGHSRPVGWADYVYQLTETAYYDRYTVDRSMFDGGPTSLLFSDGWAAHYRGPMLTLARSLYTEAAECRQGVSGQPHTRDLSFEEKLMGIANRDQPMPLTEEELDCRLEAYARGYDPVGYCGVPAAEVYGEADGSDYRGFVSVTESGRTCQDWSAQAPHAHGYGADDATGIGDHNYCRTADWHEPWCYTDDPQVRWERCDVSQGYVAGGAPVSEAPQGPTTTVSGRTCQNWMVQSPHAHTRTPANYPGQGIGDHNTCIDPDGTGAPWCYTDDPQVRWEFCQ